MIWHESSIPLIARSSSIAISLLLISAKCTELLDSEPMRQAIGRRAATLFKLEAVNSTFLLILELPLLISIALRDVAKFANVTGPS
jgi:hypothetical protein